MKNILLIGLGRFGKHIALQLNKLGHEVMAVDSNEERVNKILPMYPVRDGYLFSAVPSMSKPALQKAEIE